MPKLVLSQCGKTQEIELAGEACTIGRHTGSTVELRGDSLVSRKHGVVSLVDGVATLVDEGSSNGTFLNGVRVNPKTPYPLKDGDSFRIGSSTFFFYSGEKPPQQQKGLEASVSESKIIASLYGGADISKSIQDIPEHLRVGLKQSIAMGIPWKDLSGKKPEVAKESSVDKFYILYQLGREVVRAGSLDGVLDVAMMLIFDVINAERGAIQLFNPGTGELVTRIAWQRSVGRTPEGFTFSKTVTDLVVHNKTSLVTSDTREDPRLQNARSIVQANIRSVISVPLSDWEKDDVLGVIYLDNNMSTYAFKAEDLDLLSAIANLVAIRLKQEMLFEQLRKEAVQRTNLERFLSPDVAEMVLQHTAEGKEVCFDVVNTEATVLFADIVGFTKISEEMKSSNLACMLNEFFENMSKVVFAHNGSVNKFIGDSVFAVFGAPVDKEDHAGRAVEAGLAMQAEVERMRAVSGSKYSLRVGVNSGDVIAGYIGPSKRLEYTVLGDVVNIAKRLEEIATPGKVFIGERTFELLNGRFKTRQITGEKLKGKQRTVRMYEIIGK